MSNKEDELRAGDQGQASGGLFAERLQEHRRRAESALRAQRERLSGAGGALEQQLQAAVEQLERRAADVQRRESELQQRRDELEERAAELARQQRELDEAKSLWDRERSEAAQRQEALLEDFRQEQERLQQQQREQFDALLREVDQRSASWTSPPRAQAPPSQEGPMQAGADGDSPPSEEMVRLQERFEMAVQDVRELKRENADLLEELAELRQAGASAASARTDGLDWESQKQQILRQLESDLDEEGPEQARDKLTVEGAIRITDQVVAEKDQEIRELKRLLSERNAAIGDVAVGAAAVQEVVDQDALIREERENLQRLQEAWREKLRQAEVEISVERAKLARARAELEERMLACESSNDQEGGRSGGSKKTAQTSGGKWLARLGLADPDDEN